MRFTNFCDIYSYFSDFATSKCQFSLAFMIFPSWLSIELVPDHQSCYIPYARFYWDNYFVKNIRLYPKAMQRLGHDYCVNIMFIKKMHITTYNYYLVLRQIFRRSRRNLMLMFASQFYNPFCNVTLNLHRNLYASVCFCSSVILQLFNFITMFAFFRTFYDRIR